MDQSLDIIQYRCKSKWATSQWRRRAGNMLAVALLSACTSYGSPSGANSGSPTAPTGSAVLINVVAINGAMSFSPNPATIPADQTVVWHNVDSVPHRDVRNDGAIDTGNLDPGAYSSPIT